MSLNRVMLIGNVSKEPEINYIDSGICTARITLATSTPAYVLSNGTQVPERTEWHRIYCWRGLAEVAERYIHKGDKLYVEGELRTRNYTDKKGITRYITEVWASNIELMSHRSQQAVAGTSGSQESPATGTQTSKTNEELPF